MSQPSPTGNPPPQSMETGDIVSFPLPFDILSQIFIQCANAEIPSAYHIMFDAPVVVSSVCSFWRSVALSTPTLWSNISVLYTRGVNRAERMEKRVVLSLVRSGTSPLHIYLGQQLIQSYNQVRDSNWPPHSISVLDQLMDQSWRWHSLVVDVTYSKLLPLRKVQNNFPTLRYISIHVEGYNPNDRRVLQDIFLQCPELRTAGVEGYQVYELFPLPWHQVRHIRRTDLFSTTSIFQDHDPSLLETAHFRVSKGIPPALPTGKLYPKLRDLELTSKAFCSKSLDPTPLFLSFACPNLESLTFGAFVLEESSGLRSIISSCKHLRQLSFCQTELPESILIDTLHNTPHLEKLVMRDMGPYGDNLIDELGAVVAVTNRPVLLPKIVHLELSVSPPQVEGLIKLLERRIEHAPQPSKTSITVTLRMMTLDKDLVAGIVTSLRERMEVKTYTQGHQTSYPFISFVLKNVKD